MNQRTCKECGDPIIGRQPTAIYCSPLCRDRWRGREKYRRNTPGSKPRHKMPEECIIEDCSEPPIARDKCQRHYRQDRRGEGAPWAVLGGGHRNARGRARRHGVAYTPIDRTKVYTRDNWTCGICHTPVDPTHAFPHPMSATLDHIAPMSKGGAHTYENLQLAHFHCNNIKRDSEAA